MAADVIKTTSGLYPANKIIQYQIYNKQSVEGLSADEKESVVRVLVQLILTG